MIRFLSKEAVVEIHNDEIDAYGGAFGFLNESLLDSALAQPKFAMQFSQASIYDLAAAYGYHICKNHAFLDGNKRTAVATMMVFLEINGYRLHASKDQIIAMILSVASNETDKKAFSSWIESVARKK